MRIKVVFDSTIFLRQRFGGISRQFVELNRELASTFSNEVENVISSPLHFNRHLDELNKEKSIKNFTRSLYIPRFPNRYRGVIKSVNTKYLNRLIDRFQPDVLHHTFNSDFHDISVPARLITINDLIREKTNLSSGRSNQTRRACELASRIICISEKTKQDVIELFGLSDEKCDVVHLAPSEVFRLDSRQFIDIDSKDPYLLYVGDRAGYKNFETLISAYAKSKFLNQNFRIVCFGGPRKSRADILLMNKYKISDARIHFLSGNDHELREVYAKASALIYPSLDEGFGIPPLEAMAAGCVTVCSNRGSLPEVLGNATSYFDAESAENLKANLEDLLTDKTKMLSLQNKGLNHSATYTWQNTAAKTVAVYRNALQMR